MMRCSNDGSKMKISPMFNQEKLFTQSGRFQSMPARSTFFISFVIKAIEVDTNKQEDGQIRRNCVKVESSNDARLKLEGIEMKVGWYTLVSTGEHRNGGFTWNRR